MTQIQRHKYRWTAAVVLAAVMTGGAVLAGAAGPVLAARPTVDQAYAVLRGLDKITARVMRLEVAVGETVDFGTLDIAVRACRSTTPDEPPENAAFLQIDDEPPGQTPSRVFSGWMFSSSPALSAMDHPVYDVWLVECRATPTPPEELAPPPERIPLPESPPIPPPLPDSRRA